MNKRDYIIFVASIQQMIFDFVKDYNIPASCKLPQSKDDDIQWTLNLGDTFGCVNILLESWDSASFQGKVNVLSIPMKYHTYRDKEKLFNLRYGHINEFNGKFVLNAYENASDELKNAFRDVLDTWAYTNKKNNTPNLNALCLN